MATVHYLTPSGRAEADQATRQDKVAAPIGLLSTLV